MDIFDFFDQQKDAEALKLLQIESTKRDLHSASSMKGTGNHPAVEGLRVAVS